MASNFSEKFPKPAECESPTRILRWESRREGWLAGVKWARNEFVHDPVEYHLIGKEIKAVEESK